jgi:hypothetical protein
MSLLVPPTSSSIPADGPLPAPAAKRPTWHLGIPGRIWQPEGASQWYGRCAYLATLLTLADARPASRIAEARALDRQALAATDSDGVGLPSWAVDYGFLDDWLVTAWVGTLVLWHTDPESRLDQEIVWPPFAYFNEQAVIGIPKRTLFTHLRWLALHQVGRLTLKEIAEAEQSADGLEISTISRAVTTMAALIGLTLREAPRRRTNLPSSTQILTQ